MERSVDVETFLAIEEDNLLTQIKKPEPAKPAFDVDAFLRRLSKQTPPVEKEVKTEPAKNTSAPYNPYPQKSLGQLEGKTTVPDKKGGLMGRVEENPGTALLGSLLLAGAAYWLYDRYGRKKKPAENGEQEESQRTSGAGRGKRKSRRLTAPDKKKEENSVNGIAEETEENPAENNDAPEAAKEQPGVITMAAAAAGGVIAGKILPEYRILGAIATGAYAAYNSDLKTGCIAVGLLLSPVIAETVQSLINAFTGSPKKKAEEKKLSVPSANTPELKKENPLQPVRKETKPDTPPMQDNIPGSQETKPDLANTDLPGIPSEIAESLLTT